MITIKKFFKGLLERLKNLKVLVASNLVPLFVICIMLSALVRYHHDDSINFGDYLLILINVTTMGIVAKIAGYFGGRQSRQQAIDLTETLREQIDKDEKKDIILLMLDNLKEIKEYFRISKNQAKKSFYLAVFACVIGIIMLALAIYMAFDGKDSAIITVISGAVVEVFAGTSLLVHRDSLKQLNKYYDSLHDNERYLSSVHLISKLSDDKQDEIYIEIIKSEIKLDDKK